ncbi:MAG: TRAP transporter small permease [Spirochaetales bacterium]|nr:TRAP transporter small permease [Spirochaetales bacterium]
MNKMYRGLVYLQTFLMSVLLLIVSIQVLTRLLPFLPHFLWTEEIARFLLIWVIFLGASIGIREGTHFTVSLLQKSKSKVVNKIWDLGVLVALTAMSAIFAIRGFKYAKVMIWDISDIAQISMIWVGAAIPAFGILSLLFIIEMFVNQFNKEGR